MWCYSDSGGFSAVCSFLAASTLMVVVFYDSGRDEWFCGAGSQKLLWGIPLRFF